MKLLGTLLLAAQFVFAADVGKINENLDKLAQKIKDKYSVIEELNGKIDEQKFVDTDQKKAFEGYIKTRIAGTQWTGGQPVSVRADFGAELLTTSNGGVANGFIQARAEADVEAVIKNAGVPLLKFFVDDDKLNQFFGCPNSALCKAYESVKETGSLTSVDRMIRELIAKLDADPSSLGDYAHYIDLVKKSYSSKSANGEVVEISLNASDVEIAELGLTGSIALSITKKAIDLRVDIKDLKLESSQMGTVLDYISLALGLLQVSDESDLDGYVEFIDEYAGVIGEIFN